MGLGIEARAWGGLLIAVLIGCGGESGGGPDGGPGADAGRDPGESEDAAAPSTACSTDPATVNGDGVLTPFPHIRYEMLTPGFVLKSSNFVVTEDGDPRGPLLELFAEVENQGAGTECDFLAEVSLDFEEIVALVYGPAHYDDITSVTGGCLGPGDTGVVLGAARGIGTDDLTAATSLQMDLSPDTIGTNTLATDGPTTLSAAIAPDEEGWLVRGQLTIRTTIENYGLTVFARDDRGVLIAELTAFPGSLGVLPAGSTVDFETGVSDCPFSEVLSYHAWIRRQ